MEIAPMPKHIRSIRIQGNVAYVPLTQGCEAIIDVEDIDVVQGFNWTAVKGGRTFYACRMSRGKHIAMHRAVISAPSDKHVDHINGNGLDNRKANLRLATRSQNKHNAQRRVDNPSGYKGVRAYKDTGKFQARITSHGKQYHLGYFPTALEAFEAYKKASAELHGEFGRLS
jgi:hypothetical protein